ncbi:MAG: amino acid permease, partial [Proteobacteria bacterium]|nr:amino acid permease [Pseudomonadota bacterium]
MPHQQTSNVEVELSRDIGLITALSIGVGTMIAAGIFTLSGLAVRNVGSGAIISFLLAALVATFTALTYCEFTSIYPRSGEGYLYARKTFPAPIAWFVGWCLLLGYTSSCAFYIASLSTYFQEFVYHFPLQSISGVLTLIALTMLNMKGTKESGAFQVVVTGGKVGLLCWFIAGGVAVFSTERIVEELSTDLYALSSTAGMVFITFFGFSAIAAAAGEVINPVKNVPRAIFLSMGIVTILYTAVIIVLVTTRLTEYDEAAMGKAAEMLLGPIGGMVIVGGAIFSMIAASNASIMAGSRVAMTMSNHRHLPTWVGKVHPRTRTPAVALGITGSLIFLFAISLPLEDLAHYADAVLLLALITVNAAL